MGVVYRASDTVLGREVAIKVLQQRHTADAAVARRFIDEARIAGQLQHPGVPAVHDLGVLPDGRPFLAMKLIKGRTLNELLRDRDDPARERGRLVAVFEQVCQAIGYAHAHGVIHRDLKPDNVMVGAFGEVQVMDWGLAKLLTADEAAADTTDPGATAAETAMLSVRELDDVTRAGSVLGTPAYMPPEQAIGAVGQIDARSDVFGLGAMLCAILTGRPPYVSADGESTRQLAARAKLDDAFARLDTCGADPELVALCKRCLAAERDDRPRDAGALATAVAGLRTAAEERARHAELDRVRAEGDRKAAELKAAEGRKRRRVLAALAGSVCLLLLAGVGFAWWQDRQATERNAERALKAQQVQDAVPPLLALAADLRQQGRYPEAAAALQRAWDLLAGDEAPELRPEVVQARADLAFVRELDDIYFRCWAYKQSLGGQRTYNVGAAPPLYQAAFLARGLDFAGAPDDLAALVAKSAIRQQLIEGLDYWAVIEPDRELAGRILAVLRRVDPGSWLDQLRDPAVQADKAKMAQLLRDADPTTIPVIQIAVANGVALGHGLDTLPLLRAAQRVHPTSYALNCNLGSQYQVRGRTQEAVGYFRAAAVARPANAMLLLFLAEALADSGDLEQAFGVYREAARLDPSDPHIHDRLAFALRRSGDVDGAIQYLGDAIVRLPTAPSLRRHLGWALCMIKKDFAAGLPYLKEAVRLDAKDAQNHFELGECLLEGRQADEAAAAFLEVVRLEPSNAFALNKLGNVLRPLGPRDEAIKCYRQAIRLDPKNAYYHVNLGWDLYLKGELDEAVRELEEAVRLEPKNGEFQNYLATVRNAKAESDARKGPPQ
jgi:tetratricopeptide (TPR) repeat protein/tRNA A-37 threonylcarbamoyl transferase component Bud32